MQPREKTDRAVLWKKGRKRKDGTFDEEQEEINAKIESLICFYKNLQEEKQIIQFNFFRFLFYVDRMPYWKGRKKVIFNQWGL